MNSRYTGFSPRGCAVPQRPRFSRLFTMVLLGAVLAVAVAGGRASATPLTVSAASVPLMDAPGSGAQVLGRVQQRARLTATGRRSGDWVEVQAPPEVSGWVYGELVRDGRIVASSVKVRSGPGIGYVSLGTLTKDAMVALRGARGDWVEIAGQPSLTVWVERAMVAERAAVTDMAATAAPGARPVVSPLPLPRPAPVHRAASPPVDPLPAPAAPLAVKSPASVPVRMVDRPDPAVASPGVTPPVARQPLVPVPPPPAGNRFVGPAPSPRPVASSASASARASRGTSPVGRRLISTAPQGAAVVVSGLLRPVGFSLFAGADYRLVSADGRGPGRTLCYVAGPVKSLQTKVGEEVSIEGRKYWVVGRREPVVLVQTVR